MPTEAPIGVRLDDGTRIALTAIGSFSWVDKERPMVTLAQDSGCLVRSRLFPERLFIRVPWKQAAWMRNRLRERGLDATICYDPSERVAGLEFRPGTDPEQMLKAFRSLEVHS